MFTFLGSRQRHCDGLDRRNFLALGAFGAGLTLADQLRAKAASPTPTRSLASPKSAIMVYLPGGPSPHGHVRPEAGRPGGVSRRVQADSNERAGDPDQRTYADAGEDVRQARRRPLHRGHRRTQRQLRDDRLPGAGQPHGRPPVLRLRHVEARQRHRRRARRSFRSAA